MSVGLYSGVSGLALGTGLYKNVSGLWSGASGLTAGFGGGSPFGGASLYLDFLAGAPLDPRVTFSRGSNATLVDSTGKITYAPANLVLQSQTFDNASWAKANASVTPNAAVAPDGTATADKLIMANGVSPTSASTDGATQYGAIASNTYVVSVYAKASEQNTLSFRENLAVGSFLTVNLDTGAITPSGGSGQFITPQAVSVGNGWWRVSFVSPSTMAATNKYTIRTGQTGDGVSGIFIWGAQLEPVTYQIVPSTYNATTTAAYYGPRFDYDPVTLAAKGLLIEEQRTNLLTGSADFTATYWPVATNVVVTADNTTSPDGTNNADRMADNTTAGVQHRIYRDYTFTAASHTLSVFAKRNDHRWLRLFFFDGTTSFFGNFDLLNGVVGNKQASTTTTITAFGNGWYRCTMTATTAAAAGNIQLVMLPTDDTAVPVLYTGTGTSLWLYGAQMEAGSFATSYIPTVASTVTRSADNAEMIGTNFSSWYNASEGTFVSDFDKYSVTSRGGVLCAGNTLVATGTDIAIDGQNDAKVRVFIENAGAVEMLNATLATYAANTPIKAAVAYATNNAVGAAAGALGTVDTSVVVPTLNALQIGAIRNSSAAPQLPLNGHIRQIAYYNTRLSNTQLQTLTAPSLATTLSLSFTNQAYTVGV